MEEESIKIVKHLDNRINLNQARRYVFEQGAALVTYREFENQSSNIGNTVNITCNPSTSAHVVSRNVKKIASFRVTITGQTIDGSELLKPGYHCPAPFPILSVSQSESMTVGQASVTQDNISSNWRALMRYNNEMSTNNYINSLCPSMLDQSQDFVYFIDTNRNPMANLYGDNVLMTPRGAFFNYTVESNTSTQAVVTFESVENLNISPFIIGDIGSSTAGFAGINTASYSLQLGDLSLCMSLVHAQDGTSSIQRVEGVITRFALGFEFLQPHRSVTIPRNQVMSYYRPYLTTTVTSVPIPPNGERAMPTATVQLEGIPSRIYVWACDAHSNSDAFTPQVFLACQNTKGALQVRINGLPSLDTYTRQGLYAMSRDNGCNMDYSQFCKYTGSVICIDPSKNLGVQDDAAPGLSQKNEFSFDYLVKNTSTLRTIANPTLNVLVVYSGVFKITEGVSSWSLNPLSSDQVRLTPIDTTFRESPLSQDVFGGSLWKRAGRALKSAHDFAKENKLVSKALTYSGHPIYGKIADQLGYGAVVKGGRGRGRAMSRSELNTD